MDEALRLTHLDWLGYAEHSLSQWVHSRVDEAAIRNWISQFDRELDGAGWVGEGLLRTCRMVSGPVLADSLGLTEEGTAGFEDFCVSGQTMGKSEGVVANIARKRLISLGVTVDLRSINDALSDKERTGPILWIEDGLFTGTEMVSVLNSLLSPPHDENKSKVTSLADATDIRRRKIEMRFAVATDFGLHIVRDYLKANALDNIVVAEPAGGALAVLSESGRRHLTTNSPFRMESGIKLLARSSDIDPPTFSERLWRGRRDRARELCEEVGYRLWKGYVGEQVRTQGWSWEKWPADRLRECRLGMRGLGLALAFPHSVPKATLPVFWAGSSSSLEEGAVDWCPLFENA